MSGLSAVVRRDAVGRYVAEYDRGGVLFSTLVWDGAGLSVASLRLVDAAWLTIEPRCGAPGPWGPSDRLGISAAPLAAAGGVGIRPLTVMSALDWRAIDHFPVVAEPARLPRGATSAVLNLIATLARDQGQSRLRYDSPYPGETLFLSLLESFSYDDGVPEPLAAFRRGELTWTPAPHERRLEADSVLVQWRGRIDKVVDGPRVYVRPDWQTVRRYAPRCVRDVEGGTRCSLVLLGEVIEDHLILDPNGAVQARVPVPADESGVDALSPALVSGLAAAVAASSAPPLRQDIERAARDLAPVWGPVDRDLVVMQDDRLVVSRRIPRALRRTLARLDQRGRAELALAGLAELAALVGDALRGRAQAALAAAAAPAQARAFDAPEGHDGDAARIVEGARALLRDLAS